MGNTLHDAVFELAEKYRSKNPSFRYSLRKINNKNRLEEGTWFHGREDYAFLGLINRSGGVSKTASFGINFMPTDNDIKCNVRIVSHGESDKSVLKLYDKILALFPGFESLSNGKYRLILAKENGIKAAEEFLENYVPIIYQLIDELKLNQLKFPENDFLNNIERVSEIKSRNDLNASYWIFQGNPKVFDIDEAFRTDSIKSWNVSAHKDKIKPGDKVIFWTTGHNPGCIALGEVTGFPEQISEENDDKYYKENNKIALQVKVNITYNLIQNPIRWNDIKNDKTFAFFKAGNQGTNFSATKSEFDGLLARITTTNPYNQRYWLYAPGEGANMWDTFYDDGIMGLGWNELGDLKQYNSKEEIAIKLKNLQNTTSSKKNDASATYDFRSVISVGDVVIAKKGRKEYIGYGIVSSDYYYDKSKGSYPNIRKVEWLKKGSWPDVDGEIVLKTLTDITKYPEYVTKLKNLLGIDSNKNPNVKSEKLNYPLNTIFYGPPGTGKTYKSVIRASEIIVERKIDDYQLAKDIFNKNLHDRIEFITFHQNYSYEDFIQGIRPDIENNQNLTFERKDGIFKIISDKALKNLRESERKLTTKDEFGVVFNLYIEPLIQGEVSEIEVPMKKTSFYVTGITNKSIEFRKGGGESVHTLSIATLHRMYEAETVLNIQGLSSYYSGLLDKLLELGKSKGNVQNVSKQNYVIVIDEINRANISRVFGELITLIEPDKRSNGDVPLQVKLPSGELFIVPSNLYIIGTMNTADKSIALLDIALRRRFEFESMYPKYSIEGHEIHDLEVLRALNNEIIKTKGHDFQIGHAYFMKENKDLIPRMNNKVIPLLMEYYMNDKDSVVSILSKAGLEIDIESWPLRITGRRG